MTIADWSTTAADNNAAPPNGWPEGMLPSAVNNTGRQMMADIKTWYDTFATGSYTGSLTGCTTTPTGAFRWTLINGDTVVLVIPPISGTSNTTAATITGMPAEIRPAATRNVIGVTTNNGADNVSLVSIASSGVMTLFNVLSSTFTASGTKGVGIASTITYKISD